MKPPVGTRVVIGAFAASGTLHLVRPSTFAAMIPPALGDPKPWVIGSGAVELLCAAGLATRQPWAPRATAATLGVVWIGNFEMARRLQGSASAPALAKAAAWARLPLQVPLIVWALRSPTRATAVAATARPVHQ
jgi:uncharacterized membrane protein